MIKEDKSQDDCPDEADFPIFFSDVEDITLVDTVYSSQDTGLSREEAIDLTQMTSRSVSRPPSKNAKSSANDAEAIFQDIYTKAGHNSHLREHLVADLKNIRGKMNKMMARGVGLGEQVRTQPTSPTRDGDNSLKWKKGPLERKCRQAKR